MCITSSKWVIMLAQQQVNVTTHEWVNPEKVYMATPECIRFAAQWWVNVPTIDQVCMLVQTLPSLDSTVYCLCKSAFTDVLSIAIPAYQEVCIGGPLLQNFVVLH